MLLAVRAFRPDDLNTYVQRVEKLLGHHTHDEPQDQHWCDIGLGKAEPTRPEVLAVREDNERLAST